MKWRDLKKNVERVEKQWEAAEAASRQALALKPDDVVALDVLGFALGKKGQLEQAAN